MEVVSSISSRGGGGDRHEDIGGGAVDQLSGWHEGDVARRCAPALLPLMASLRKSHGCLAFPIATSVFSMGRKR